MQKTRVLNYKQKCNVYDFRQLWPLNDILKSSRWLLDLQKVSRAPVPFGPVCSACWQLRTEQWHSGPPLHRPEWVPRRTNGRCSLVNLQASRVMTPTMRQKFYLDQFCCRSDHRRAELADLLWGREWCMLWKHQNRGVHRWSCDTQCIWRSTKLAF